MCPLYGRFGGDLGTAYVSLTITAIGMLSLHLPSLHLLEWTPRLRQRKEGQLRLAAEGFTAARLREKLCRTGEADMSSAGEQLMKE